METAAIYRYTITGFGQPWTLVASERGLRQLLFPPAIAARAGERPAALPDDPTRIEDRGVFERFGVLERLERYFAGEPVSFDGVPLDLQGTPFQQRIWTALGSIPYGETRTYRQVADAAGRPTAVRAVGAANGRNPLPVILPCHRVVGADGTLTGYRGGLEMKQRLLALEGITHMKADGHERFRF